MNTQLKLRIARVLYQTVKTARACVGAKSEQVECVRSGLRWNLDLSEGIDLSIYLFGQFERSTTSALRTHLFPGAVALDIGANVGAHALPMAKLVGPSGKVYAFEPTDWAFGKMTKNASLNPDLQSSLFPMKMILSDLKSDMPKHIYSSWKLESGETHPIHGGHLNSVGNSEVASLDSIVKTLGLKKIDLIKLDVDGFEFKVLSGGAQMLSEMRPKMILEVTPYSLEEQGDSLEALIAFMAKLNYRFYTENGKQEIPLNAEALRKKLPPLGGFNVLALPMERP